MAGSDLFKMLKIIAYMPEKVIIASHGSSVRPYGGYDTDFRRGGHMFFILSPLYHYYGGMSFACVFCTRYTFYIFAFMHTYEIEIKSLLGSPDKASHMLNKMCALDRETKRTKKNKQFNHYFIGGTIARLCEIASSLFSENAQARLKKIAADGKEFSIRSRQQNENVLLVIKASIDDTTSANGIARIEFEEQVPKTLAELDSILLSAGYTYQAKWSREREEYLCKGITVCLDKNAGYGYVAEFEKMVASAEAAESTEKELRDFMAELGADELPQDRLERMFAYYNKNWPDYYGTEKIFNVE